MYFVYPQFIWTILVPTSGVRTRRGMINFPFVQTLTAIPKFNNGPGFGHESAQIMPRKIPGESLIADLSPRTGKRGRQNEIDVLCTILMSL